MEIIANAVQTVLTNQSVLFTDTVAPGNCAVMHRAGSGLVTVKGNTNQCRARYRITFAGNMALSTGATVEPISLAIAVEGETLPATTMTITPAAVGDFWNVFGHTFLDVPRGCCMSVSVKNISAQSIDVQNANLIIERVA
jgi:hypothetical protein